MMRPGPFFVLRITALICALTLGVLAVWIVAAETISPRPGFFPRDAKEAQSFAATRQWAGGAALIGMARGDLWTAAAIAEAGPQLFDPPGAARNAPASTETSRARIAAMHAAKLSPHDSRNWLVLAALAGEPGSGGINAADALKLSYYTGPGNPALTPLRLSLAARSPVTADEELKSFVELEIRQILTRQPDIKPLLATVYAGASAEGAKLIEDALSPVDPAFLATIKRR